MAFAGSSHILFGTDSPYEHGVSAAFTAALDTDSGLTADDQTAISHGNAQTLFPRLAQPDSHHRAPRRMTLPHDTRASGPQRMPRATAPAGHGTQLTSQVKPANPSSRTDRALRVHRHQSRRQRQQPPHSRSASPGR